MRKASTLFQVLGLGLGLMSSAASGKGLEELADKNPETAPPEPAESEPVKDSSKDKPVGETSEAEGEAEATSVKPSAASNALKGKAFLFTSLGWVRASQAEGSWSSSGFSDFGFAYQVASISDTAKLSVTYRYNPVAVTGTVNNHSYRGVWETHNLGALMRYSMPKRISAVAGGEVGYLRSHLSPTDGLTPESKAVKHGVTLTLSGGGDYKVSETGEFTLGPRLYFSLGASTQVQFGLTAGFGF